MGKKYLTLPGINPSPEFLSQVNTKQFYEKMMEQVINYAELREDVYGVYLPTDKVIHSNRSDIQKIIAKKYQGKAGRLRHIDVVNWSTYPEFPFDQVYVVFEKSDEFISERFDALLGELALDEHSLQVLAAQKWSVGQQYDLLKNLKRKYAEENDDLKGFADSDLFYSLTDLLENESFQAFPLTKEQKYKLLLQCTQKDSIDDWLWDIEKIYDALPDALDELKTLAWEEAQYYELLSKLSAASEDHFHHLLNSMSELTAIFKTPDWHPEASLGRTLFEMLGRIDFGAGEGILNLKRLNQLISTIKLLR